MDLLKEIQKLKRENRKLKRQLEAIQKIIFGKKETQNATILNAVPGNNNEQENKDNENN
jgi:cell shape-determining protein MreC